MRATGPQISATSFERDLGMAGNTLQGHDADRLLKPSDWSAIGLALPSIFDRFHEGVIILDFEGRYLYMNETVARDKPVPASEFIGRKVTEVYPGIESTEMYSLLQRCITERTPQQMLHRHEFPDGRVA